MPIIKSEETASPEKTERLGIVIVHFGDNKLRTFKCLESFIKAASWLKKNKPFIETSITVADNSGNLNLENYCSLHCDIRHFNPGSNLGYAGACYSAAKLLEDCSMLIFSNNDVVLREDSLFNMLESMKSLPDAGAIQPLVLIEGSSKVDSIGLTFNPIMQVFNYCNWPIKPIRDFSLKNGAKALETFGVDGMLFMLSRRVWSQIDGWDPQFFMFNEDSLLSWKLRLRGYRNYVALNSVIYHERGGSAEGYYVKKKPIFPSYYISRNRLLSVLYIHEGTWLIIYFFESVILEFVKNLMLSIKNRSAMNLYYYFKALTFVLNKSEHVAYERGKVLRKFGARSFQKKGYVISLSKSFFWLFKRRKSIDC